MTTVSSKDGKNRLTALARRLEAGERVTVTRRGRPILDRLPHRRQGGTRTKPAAPAGW